MRRAALAFVLLLFALTGCEREAVPPAACADLTQGCTIAEGIRVRADRAPSALHPFTLTVRAQGARQVYAEFVMQGMEMGLNRYRLTAADNGVWQGSVTLPVCVTGRRDWVLWVEVDGQRRGLAFQTQ